MANLPNNYLRCLWRKLEANENVKVMKFIIQYNFSNRRKFYTLKKGSAKELTYTSLVRTFSGMVRQMFTHSNKAPITGWTNRDTKSSSTHQNKAHSHQHG